MSRAKRRITIRKPRKEQRPGFWAALRGLLLPAMIFLAVLVLGGTAVLWRTGKVGEWGRDLTAAAYGLSRHAGFSVKEIVVEGRTRTERGDILKVLGAKKGSPILAFDPHEALEKLCDISWVKNGTVERRLPSTIYVRLTERKPIALWQHNKRFFLIDDEGHALREAPLGENPALPLVVGAGAGKEAAALLTQLSRHPSIFRRMRAAVRVGKRRWDLHMDNKIIVKLPEEDAKKALTRLDNLISRQNILDRDIVALDLRLPDRMTVETPPPPGDTKKPGKNPKAKKNRAVKSGAR